MVNELVTVTDVEQEFKFPYKFGYDDREFSYCGYERLIRLLIKENKHPDKKLKAQRKIINELLLSLFCVKDIYGGRLHRGYHHFCSIISEILYEKKIPERFYEIKRIYLDYYYGNSENAYIDVIHIKQTFTSFIKQRYPYKYKNFVEVLESISKPSDPIGFDKYVDKMFDKLRPMLLGVDKK